MQYTVSNPGGQGQQGDNRASIKVSGMSCSGQCSPLQEIPDSANFNATLTAPTVSAGQNRSVTVTVTATLNGETGTASETITVNGPAAPTTVRQISGRIKDDGGARVSGVQVAIQDSAGHSYNTTTGSDGSYSFTSSDSKPIAAGSITVGAAKDGYESTTVTVEGTAGRTVNVPLTIKKVAAETTSPTPSASATTSAAPEDEATEEEPAESTAPLADANLDNTSGTEEEGSNWLLIIMGVLLVAAGIGAMVLVWMRRKNAADELGSDTGLGKAVPAAAGGFDATRVAAPVGGGRGSDATMIAPAGGMGAPRGGGMGGSLADAPTMIHRPAEDEFPDPYGAPMPAAGGFNGGGNPWGGDQGGNYGGATQTYGQQGGGYGAAGQGGFNDPGQQRYDEHTSLYQPEPGGYPPPQQGGNYGAAGYEQQGGYDQQQGGYGDQGGWGGQDAGGYGQQQGGYDQQPGAGAYGGGGYDQQPGGYPQQQQGGNYGGAAGYDDGGYDQQQGGGYGGYDQQQQGGYGDQRGTYGNPRPNREWNDS